MDAESWTHVRREFERVRELEHGEREAWLRDREKKSAGSTRRLRALLEADGEVDALLDGDAPSLHDAWSRSDAARAAIGSVLAGHRIVEVIGEGGSATVYRGEGSPNVAVKVLKRDAFSPGLAGRFDSERETLAGLDHPGLIRVLGAGHLDDGRPYLVTEYVDGAPIDKYCEARELALAARVRLLVDVCRAVHHAHRHLVVHRDLKPSNILVSADGRPKVLDFGVAKLLDPARDPLWTDLYGRGPLTLAYASPEQVRGEAITTASDVYSLGVLLHELATGASPYEPTPRERDLLERAVSTAQRRSPLLAARSKGRPAPPRDVIAILDRALAARPIDRYESAEHLAQDLECFLEHRPLASRREPWMRRVASIARRRPWTVGVSTAIALLFAGSWIGTALSLRRVTASEGVAWRAHASAVQSTNLLADLLERIGSTAPAGDEIATLVAQTERVLPELADHPETEARLRMALARLERARGNTAAAETHLTRALELSRTTRGLGWQDTDRCLELLCELRRRRADPSWTSLARERIDLALEHSDPARAAELRRSYGLE